MLYDNSMIPNERLMLIIDLLRTYYSLTIKQLAEEINVKPWVLYDARRNRTRASMQRAAFLLKQLEIHYPQEVKEVSRYIVDKTYNDYMNDKDDIQR